MGDGKDAVFRKLARIGVLNTISPEMDEDKPSGRLERTANCYSRTCAKRKDFVRKEGVKFTDTFCPTCGHALVWQTVRVYKK